MYTPDFELTPGNTPYNSKKDRGMITRPSVIDDILLRSTQVIWGFPDGSVVKSLLDKKETWVWSLGWEDSPAEGNSNPLQ